MINIFKRLFFWRNYTTAQHLNWWKKRDKDWSAELKTFNHPHRLLLLDFLNMCDWSTLGEIGCGSGANLHLIKQAFKGKRLCGLEPNEKAVEWAKKNVNGVEFRIGNVNDIFATDKTLEVVMTDMTLIYVGPRRIKQALQEIKRVATKYVLLCEFHHKNWFKRQMLRIRFGYHSYNYKKLLQNIGFYDIIVHKLKNEDWPDDKRNADFRHIILAKVTQK